MIKRLSALLLAFALAPGLWWQSHETKPSGPPLVFLPQPVPPQAELAPHLGTLVLERAWQLRSASAQFGSYSGLVPIDAQHFLAISDRGHALPFVVPGKLTGPVPILRLATAGGPVRDDYDAEAITRDPASGKVWIAWETSNAIARFSPDLRREGTVGPPEMADWGVNGGPESLVRLADGRFIALREAAEGWFAGTEHQALLFREDPLHGAPPLRFRFASPAHFDPVDMAQLPDGRVLILLRRAVWPLPLRFAGRIVIADPAAIAPGQVWRGREVARLTSSIGVDNFEGIAITARTDGRVNIWLISDDNGAATQRTLLWQLSAEPAEL